MNKIIDLLGNRAEYYLGHTCKTIDKSLIHVPSADTIDKVWINSDRNIRTLNSLQTLLGHGRLANTGYVSHAIAVLFKSRWSICRFSRKYFLGR